MFDCSSISLLSMLGPVPLCVINILVLLSLKSSRRYFCHSFKMPSVSVIKSPFLSLNAWSSPFSCAKNFFYLFVDVSHIFFITCLFQRIVCSCVFFTFYSIFALISVFKFSFILYQLDKFVIGIFIYQI